MSVQRIKLNELPKSTRNKNSPIKQTRDWKDAIAHIRKRDFEALRIEFAPSTIQGKATPIRFKRLLAAELKRMGLDDVWKLIFRGKILYVVPVRKFVVKQESGEPAVISAGKITLDPKDFDDESESQTDAPRR